MAPRLALVVALAALLLVAGTATGDPGSEKARIDARIGAARADAERAAGAERLLTGELSRLSAEARTAQASVAVEEGRLAALEASLATEQRKLTTLVHEIASQSARLVVLERQYGIALKALERRVREIYESDSPDLISFALGATSFTDLMNHLDLLDRIGRQDEQVASSLANARDELERARAATERSRREREHAVALISSSTAAQRAARDRIVAERDALASAEGAKQRALAGVREDRASYVAEAESLAAESASLAARIAAAQAAAASPAPSSPSGPPAPTAGASLQWPVSGPVTSGFGVRWGRMHEGIDIAVPSGAAVHAAAAGTVVYAGWLGGYGNIVVIDHGNGLSTAYGHNSSLQVKQGASVAAGSVIALSGSTGHSTGPHVHFEVRVSGAPVDPMGYL